MSMSKEEYKEFYSFRISVEREMDRINERIFLLDGRIEDSMRAFKELKMKGESITDGETHIIHSFDGKEEKPW